MITYSIFDDTGNLVDASKLRGPSLVRFVACVSQDASDMLWIAQDEDGKIIESLVYDPKCPAPYRARKAAQERQWMEDHFCSHGEPIDACPTCNVLDDEHPY